MRTVAISFYTVERNSVERLLSTSYFRNNTLNTIYDPEDITELYTDASKYGYGATLFQKKSNKKHFYSVYYLNYKTTEVEKKWRSYELKVLAVIKAVKK